MKNLMRAFLAGIAAACEQYVMQTDPSRLEVFEKVNWLDEGF